MTPLHPEPVAGHPQLMVWVLPPGTFRAAGPVFQAPGELGAMLADGPLDAASVQPGGGRLLLRLRPGTTWPQAGARVRTALHAALAAPHDWLIRGTGSSSPSAPTPGEPEGDGGDIDALLREAAAAVLAGEFGDYVRSHGGRVELACVADGVVSVRFRGACRGCPAAAITLHTRFERELRARCPLLVCVRLGRAA